MTNKSRLSSVLRKLHLLAAAEHIRFIAHRLKYRKSNNSFKKRYPDIIFPPNYLVYETYKLNLEEYYNDGKITAAEIIALLQKNYKLSAGGITILDWGCGPGRIVRHLPELLPQASIYATDYNNTYVKWCQDNLKLVNCSLNGINPPLDYLDAFFDVIIGISIFTHLSKQNHIAWINELRRILKPGGIAYITTQGISYRSKLLTSEQKLFDSGELVIREAVKEGNRLFSSFHPPEFIKALIAGKFEILDLISTKSFLPSQDIWILRRIS